MFEKLDELISIEVLLQRDSKSATKLVTNAYRAVFRGHPWHEDFICASENCKMQFTRTDCKRIDLDRQTGATKLDCSLAYMNRDNITLLTGDFDECPECETDLKLKEFYPAQVNHIDVFEEAVGLDGFSGYVGLIGDSVVGFSWGFTVPRKSTKTVDFDELSKIIESKGVIPEKSFYAAEVGVIADCQDKGFGSVISLSRILDAANQGNDYLVLRTINHAVHAIFERAFNGKKAVELHFDKAKGAYIYKWDFKDFNRDYAEKKIQSKLS